jgi:DNA-binding protein HU-beta
LLYFNPTITPDVKGTFVNKTELIEHIAADADISKAAATRALESALETITSALKKGDAVSLVGFGTFEVSHR